MILVMAAMTMTGVAADNEGNIKVLADYTTQEAITASGLTASSDITLNGDVSGKFKKSGWNVTEFKVSDSSNPNFPTDWTGYTNINILMYSSVAQNTKLNLLAYTGSEYNISYIPLDFKGWKKVSVPLYQFTHNGETETTFNQIDRLVISATGWNSDYFGGSTSHWAIDGNPLYFDKVYLSTETTDSTEYEVLRTEYVGNWDMRLRYLAPPYDDTDCWTYFTRNNAGMYKSSLFWRPIWQANNVNIPFASTVDLSKYSYVNMWMRSNETGTTGGKFGLQFFNTETGDKNCMIGYFGGDRDGQWKLVSIPTSEFTKNGNGSLTSVNKLLLQCRYYGTSFGDKADFQFERIWFSEALPSGMARILNYPEQDGAKSLSVSDKVFRFEFDERISVATDSAEITLTKKVNGENVAVEGVSAYADDTTLVVAADSLDYGTEYTLSLGSVKLAQGYSADIDDGISFTTEQPVFDITEPVITEADGKYVATSSVTQKGGNKNVTLVIASYNGNKLVSVKAADFTPDSGKSQISVDLDKASAGSSVKAFVFDGINTLKPYETLK